MGHADAGALRPSARTAYTSLMQQVAEIAQGEHFHAEGSIEEYSSQLQDIFERIGGNPQVELIR